MLRDLSFQKIHAAGKLIHTYAECVGIKTSCTESAERCLNPMAKRGDNEALTVILASSWEGVWIDAESVLKWSLNQ